MARIIESSTSARRLIKLSTEDILSIVRDYQAVVPRYSDIEDVRSYLQDRNFFIPEDV